MPCRTFLPLLVFCAAIVAPPGAAQEAADPDPQQYLHDAITILQDNHYRADDADWVVLQGEAQALLEANGGDLAAAHGAIRYVITALGERHSFLVTADVIRAQQARYAASTDETGNSDGTGPAPPVPFWRATDAQIGYMVLPALSMMHGGAAYAERYEATLRGGMQELDPGARCGWIIDLRGNGGGNMWPMLRGLDPLLGDAPFGFFVTQDRSIAWTRSEEGLMALPEAQPTIAPAFALENAAAPVAVLLSDHTASTGEMVALSLIGRANVRTFGEPTAGLSTANSTFPLPDGANLVVTVSKAADRLGRVADGSITPDEETTLEQAPFAARDWLLGQCDSGEVALAD